jgi:hypothetical protein
MALCEGSMKTDGEHQQATGRYFRPEVVEAGGALQATYKEAESDRHGGPRFGLR